MPPNTTALTTSTATITAKPKWFGKSWTIWGGVIAAASAAAPIISAITGADITADDVNEVGKSVASVGQAVGGFVGLVMVLYGRLRKSQAPLTIGSENKTVTMEVPKTVKVEK